MSIRALQDYTYYSKYARYDEEKKRRETWSEAVERVKNMHVRRYPEITEEIEWAFDLVHKKKVLGSQRALQFGGKPVEKKHARLYNCWSSYCDRLRFFQETLWILLAGGGVGFSVQKHHVNKLPNFTNKQIGSEGQSIYFIDDSIEGWADSLGVLLATYMPSEEYPQWEGKDVIFDYSKIRPEGSYLSSGVAKAPGPKPLKRALDIIKQLLDNCIKNNQKRLKPIDAYDIVMHSSDAVLSGGIRRAATIALFSHDDDEMIKAKTGNWLIENPQRARSNNSALLIRNDTSKEEFLEIIQSVKEYGEPGFFWSDSTEQVFNPCGEIGMYPVDVTTGESGFQACNLTEINGGKIKTEEDFVEVAKAAAIIGTVQAGYTDFPYLGKTTENIVRREALLGVSITGMMDNPDVIFDAEVQKKIAQTVKKINREIAKKIGINQAARTTCVKPAGTTSCILGTASGVHPHHAKRYFRRVQANQLEPIFQYFKTFNSRATELSVWSANETDEVITFCIEVPPGAKTKNDLSAVKLLEYVKNTQQNWVTQGKNAKLCTQEWLGHNVSNTINVKEDEWDDVADYIYRYRKYFAGVSLLPASGDLDYPQAPMVNVLTPRELLHEYGDAMLLASGLIVDGLHAFDDNLWKACDAVLGLGKPIEEPSLDPISSNVKHIGEYRNWKKDCELWANKVDWIRRVKQFAERYYDGNLKTCCRLLKHVNNWKLWLDLQREYVDVDYTNLIEEENNTKLNETLACVGGACEI